MAYISEEFPCDVPVALSGPAGSLEALTTCPADGVVKATAVICHPHPQYGGNMHNKVVHTLARSFAELGLRTVRFNFRGVGASAGEYGGGIGETEDVLAVLRWLRTCRPLDEIWLAGFSFGAFMALRAASQFAVTRLILVAPPVRLYPELGVAPTPTAPTLVLQGKEDDVVSPTAVQAWAGQVGPLATLRMFSGVGHFFHGRLNDLRAAVHQVLTPELPHG